MRYSIYILLFFVYTLMAVITFFVARMIRRESRSQTETRPPE